MRKMKRGVAVALAATMVLGSAVTAFAADTNSGTSTGTGESEGHVEKKATKVMLPVENTDYKSDTFSYKMDPERLISGTSGGKYEDDATFPAASSDTGVYFKTGDKAYENASTELKVTNQSSHNIDLTIKAEAVSAAKDIPLVEKNAIATAENASLYLGLVVGDETGVAIGKDTAATKTISVAGKPGNFKVAVKADKSGYEYRALSLEEYRALDAANASATELPWEAQKFKLEGSATKDKEIASDTTAPQVKVTWSWVDPTAAPETVAGGIFYDDSTNDWWLGTSDSAGFEKGITLGDVKVNGQAIDGIVTEFEGEDWVVIKWNDYVDAGYDQDETEFDFTAVVNGITYTAHYTYGG